MILEKLLNLGRKIIPGPIFTFFQPAYHFLLGLLAVLWYGFPSRKLKVIGVTGTNGKSTVVFLVSQILEKADYQVAAVSSIQFKIRDKVWPNDLKMTMPGRMKLQKFLRQAAQAGCQYVVLEVTSEGIKQHRHRFIGFEVAVLTNLTPEHIESHGGFENYKKAKGKLFQALKSSGKAVVNLDDSKADYFLQFQAKEKYGYRVKNQESRIKNSLEIIEAKECRLSAQGVSFLVNQTKFNLSLLGKFNVYNALAAIAVGLAEKIPLDKIKSALAEAKTIPGRLEIVIQEPFTVIVDYAHTPDALEKVYQTIREFFSGRLIGVLGAAGGGRDKWKRSEFGKIVEKYLDKIIITNEDPYDENPEVIMDEIIQGVKQKQPEKIIDRREAIARALKLAQEDDVVIITGKGCEPWMCLTDGKRIPWDDRKVVKEEFYNSRSDLAQR
jgi:UDP-N-acetylmuramoyl-L-alanyl-D-glutamate--2,6-diaminopimelate ligase